MKRREAKGKGEKDRYTHLNAEFQRIARGRMQSLGLKGREVCRLEQQRCFRKEVAMTWRPAVEREGQDWICQGTEKNLNSFVCVSDQVFY